MVFGLNSKYVQRASLFTVNLRRIYICRTACYSHIVCAPKSLLIKEDNNIIMIAWVFGNDP